MLNCRNPDARAQNDKFRVLKRALAQWPDSLRFDSLSHIQRVMGGNFEFPEKVETHLTRRQLAAVKNPFGKALLVDLLEWEPDFARNLFQIALTDNELSMTVVAINVYGSRHGRLLEDLKALVMKRFLMRSLPTHLAVT